MENRVVEMLLSVGREERVRGRREAANSIALS
jgi:hypothetical protein